MSEEKFDNQLQEDETNEEEQEYVSSSFKIEEIPPLKITPTQRDIKNFNSFVPDINIQINESERISFYIPTSFLPLTLQVAYNFSNCEHIFDVEFELFKNDWNTKCLYFEFTNKDNPNYCCRFLVDSAVNRFFSKDYKPKQNYRSAPLLLSSKCISDPNVVKKLMDQGYTSFQAERAASFCQNNFDESVTFLQTGQHNQQGKFEIPLSYRDCHVLYLVLEMFDAILDLQDHCLICGKPMQACLKPSVCTNPACEIKFTDLGIGTSVTSEIARDELVADFLFSVMANAYGTPFFNPKPILSANVNLDQIIKKMPSMKQMSCLNDDFDLIHMIGNDAKDVLRWTILTCRSNFIQIPPSLEFDQFRSKYCKQFMAITASPEQEIIFQQLKEKFGGSIFLWHGSNSGRWHSIIRQGLKNATETHLLANGAALGQGIYFAPDSATALGYSLPVINKYVKSKIGEKFSVVALCEVVKLPIDKHVSVDVLTNPNDPSSKRNVNGKLSNFNWAYTLTMEEACIVRFVFVNLSAHVNVLENPPTNIPTLSQILKLRAHIK